MRELIRNRYPALFDFYVVAKTLCALVGTYAIWLGIGSFLRGEIAEGWGIASREIAGLIWWVTVLVSAGGAVYFWVVAAMRANATEEAEPEQAESYRIDRAGNVLYSPAAEMERLQGLTGDYFFWRDQLNRYKKQHGYEKVRGYCLSQMQKANTTYKQEIEIGETIEL